jgi:hypothetical protein
MQAKNEDEVDLVSLIVRIARTVRKNMVLIAIMVVVGAAAGFLWGYLYPKTYQSKMLMTSEVLTFASTDKLINSLQDLVEERKYETLSKKLNLSASQAKTVMWLTATSAVDEAVSEGTKRSYLIVTAALSTEHGFDSLQVGLIQYFENNDFVKVRVRQRREMLLQLQGNIESELKSVEELKQNIYAGNFLEKTNGNVMFDPTAVNSKILDLKKTLLDNKYALERARSVEVIDGFTSLSRPTSGIKLRSTVTGGLIGGFLALCVIALRFLDQAVRQTEQERA